MPCNLDGKLGFCIICPPKYVVCIEAYCDQFYCVLYVCMYYVSTLFVKNCTALCYFCVINWDPKVHKIDASHSHKS